MRTAATVWKIAPGDHADDWDVFRDGGCIGLGWLPDGNYRDFVGSDDVLAALRLVYGNRKGCRDGAARMIHQFVNEVKEDDVVVANKGYDAVVGIGVMKGNYVPPRSPLNPLRRDDTTHRHHVRLVDWVVKEEVRLPVERFFVQATLWQLPSSKFAQVVKAYLAGSTPTSSTKAGLDRVLNLVSPDSTEVDSIIEPPTKRVHMTICRVARDTRLARLVKLLHDYVCQDCGRTIERADGSRYAESHHIRPLGSPHDGPDSIGNILCLCPNCHAEYDFGVKAMSVTSLRQVEGHDVDGKFIRYHNTHVYQAR